jgi:hypothetical protein
VQMPFAQTSFELKEASLLFNLAEKTLQAKNLQELSELFLQGLITLTENPAAFLFLEKSNRHMENFFQVGLPPEAVSTVASLCEERLRQPFSAGELPPETLNIPPYSKAWLYLYPLFRKDWTLGLLGILKEALNFSDPCVIKKAVDFFICALNKQIDEFEQQRQISNFNTYMNISSMIAQALDLKDVLEAVLYFCMESFGVEAASVLLLDYEKKNFRFYSAEGPAKPVLLMASFPADHGLAGAVLATQQAEVINDVQNDPRFFKKFDQESGFVTRNMIAVPLTAGEEKIGVLQILNRFEGDFHAEDLLFLQTIAEEIAFATRNAKLFEVVVKSYCKQRQGLNSCRGCKRPLGSWTPCVKYREEANLLQLG